MKICDQTCTVVAHAATTGALLGGFTAVSIKPPEAPNDVRLTFDVPYDEWRVSEFTTLRGLARIARQSAEAAAPAVDPDLLERLRRALAFHPKALAVSIDVGDVKAVLQLLGGDR